MTSLVMDEDVQSDAEKQGTTLRKRGFGHFIVRHRRILLGTLGLVAMLGSWELTSDLKIVNPVYASKPSLIAVALYKYFNTGGGLHNVAVSGTEFGIGMAMALVVGMIMGMLIGWYQWIDHLLDPLINLGYAAPRIALVPLFVVWFGIGTESKVAIVFLSAVFPILLNTVTGTKTTDAALIRVARSFKATNLQLFRTVVLPGALPQIVTGIRLAIGLGLVGMVVGELVASTAGVGYTIEVAGSNFQFALCFAAVFIVSMTGVILTQLMRYFERKLDRWRPSNAS